MQKGVEGMQIDGTGVSKGKKRAILYDVRRKKYPDIIVTERDVEQEQKILLVSFTMLDQCYDSLCQTADRIMGRAVRLLLDGHRCMAADLSYRKTISDCIQSETKSAEQAVIQVTARLTESMLQSEDNYLQARRNDFIQVSQMLIDCIQEERGTKEHRNTMKQREQFIAYGNNFSMEELMMLFNQGAVGFLDEAGDEESHTVMMAKALELPMVLQCSNQLTRYFESMVTVDGDTGRVTME